MNKFYSILKRGLLLVAFLSGFGNLMAQTMMPLPPHSSVYSSMVRGYWFTAPVNFTITGLRVSASAGAGTQSIQLMKINDPTPVVWGTTSTNLKDARCLEHLTLFL